MYLLLFCVANWITTLGVTWLLDRKIVRLEDHVEDIWTDRIIGDRE